MPNITVEMLAGRSLDQRRKFAEAVTAAAADILGVRPESVRIRYDEHGKADYAKGGTLGTDL
ncbi:tautomerase family protein [Streptomyces sp. ODS28]|uniref:tautomerase family protein n=1 Tax=Streptomyces sp. ODS28 TaxID=3136688 RepID=UPI0031E8BB9E